MHRETNYAVSYQPITVSSPSAYLVWNKSNHSFHQIKQIIVQNAVTFQQSVCHQECFLCS